MQCEFKSTVAGSIWSFHNYLQEGSKSFVTFIKVVPALCRGLNPDQISSYTLTNRYFSYRVVDAASEQAKRLVKPWVEHTHVYYDKKKYQFINTWEDARTDNGQYLCWTLRGENIYRG